MSDAWARRGLHFLKMVLLLWQIHSAYCACVNRQQMWGVAILNDCPSHYQDSTGAYFVSKQGAHYDFSKSSWKYFIFNLRARAICSNSIAYRTSFPVCAHKETGLFFLNEWRPPTQNRYHIPAAQLFLRPGGDGGGGGGELYVGPCLMM